MLAEHIINLIVILFTVRLHYTIFWHFSVVWLHRYGPGVNCKSKIMTLEKLALKPTIAVLLSIWRNRRKLNRESDCAIAHQFVYVSKVDFSRVFIMLKCHSDCRYFLFLMSICECIRWLCCRLCDFLCGRLFTLDFKTTTGVYVREMFCSQNIKQDQITPDGWFIGCIFRKNNLFLLSIMA